MVDRTGKNVLVANYGGGSVAVLPIGPTAGWSRAPRSSSTRASSVDPRRQKAPHAHSINLDADNRFASPPTWASTRCWSTASTPAKGTLTRQRSAVRRACQPGSGPRHFAFHPDGRFAYVINEMHCTVTAFALRRRARRAHRDPDDLDAARRASLQPGYSTAEVQVHPSGKFLYGSNRGHDSIAMFADRRRRPAS